VEVGGVVPHVMVSMQEFCAFYRAELPSVYGYLLRLCAGDKALAEDLTQDVWVALVEELRRGRDERADRRWLIAVARSRFLDHARRERMRDAKLRLFSRPNEPDMEPTIDQVLRRLDALQPLYRAVLVLRYVDELSVPEVAAVINRDITATNSLLARARTQLRRVGRGDPDDR
jgi:RNA polymerase sigma-70 factor (ECF subfamily)